jgi:hypothetical protein
MYTLVFAVKTSTLQNATKSPDLDVFLGTAQATENGHEI